MSIMEVNSRLQKYIIRKMVKGVVFNPETLTYSVTQKSISDNEWQELVLEAGKYGIAEEPLRKIVKEIDDQTTFYPKREISFNLNPDDIKAGQHLCLHTISPEYGPAQLELLCLEPCRFFVLKSDRNVLIFEDELESITKPWNVGFIADFLVFREGKRYPDTTHVYRTYKIDKIELLHPADVYELLDAEKSDYVNN